MHFYAVLILIGLHVHPLKLLRCIKFRIDLRINFEIIKRRCILFANRQCAFSQSNVMRRSKNENSLYSRRTNLTIGPCCSLARVRVTSVRLKKKRMPRIFKLISLISYAHANRYYCSRWSVTQFSFIKPIAKLTIQFRTCKQSLLMQFT